MGATTRAGALASPLRDRFGVLCRLEFYGPAALLQIVTRAAEVLNVAVEKGGAEEIARRARGTPRVANRLLKRVRDFALIDDKAVITREVADRALGLLEVDACGLDRTDRRILTTIIEKFNGGPVGVDTIAAAVSEETETIEDVYEPFLLQMGFLNRTPRGRAVTGAAYRHLGLACREPLPERQDPLWKD